MLKFIAVVFILNAGHLHLVTGFHLLGNYQNKAECTLAIKQQLPKYVAEIKAEHPQNAKTLWGVCLNDTNAFGNRQG